MSLALVSQKAALLAAWNRNELWTRARAVPSLDLRFDENKSLVDATTGAQLVTFTRASSGTFVGSDGVLRTAVTNLLLRSEEFDTTWVKTSSAVTPNSTAAPNGTVTADTITWGALATAEVYQFVTLTAATHTLSVYARSSTGTKKFRLKYYNGTTDLFSTEFTATTNWQQFSYTFTGVAVSGNVSVRNSSPAEAGDLVVWGAQLEQSATVGEYIPTTSTINSAPRFDHNPITGESLGLWVEEQRTNLLLRSEEFDNASWAKINASVVANAGTAPSGTATADRVEHTGGGGTFRSGISVTSGLTYTYSVFAKYVAGDGIFTDLGFENLGSGAVAGKSSFNLLTGTVVGNGPMVLSSSINPIGNDWYRLTVTAATTGTLVALVNYSGTSGNQFLLWGAQLEAGAFPTSYIPTTTAAATRSADVASISGSNFSSWYRQDEGTVFWDGSFNTIAINTPAVTIFDSAGAESNRHSVRVDNTIITSGGSTVASFKQIPTVSARTRFGYGYAANSFCQAMNSVILTDTLGAVPVGVNTMEIGKVEAFPIYTNGPIRRLTYWPQRLGNEVLQRITQ